jgi:hypothetical protein
MNDSCNDFEKKNLAIVDKGAYKTAYKQTLRSAQNEFSTMPDDLADIAAVSAELPEHVMRVDPYDVNVTTTTSTPNSRKFNLRPLCANVHCGSLMIINSVVDIPLITEYSKSLIYYFEGCGLFECFLGALVYSPECKYARVNR